MKMVRTLSALALSAMLVGASVLPASAAFQQSVLDGIILIRSGAPDADGTMTYWQGTGFFVGEEGQDPQYIVTNCHVVEDFILAGKALGGGELHVLFDQDDEAEAYLVDYDAEKDLAVLRLAEPTDKRAPLSMRQAEDSMLGDEVYAVGYPLAADVTVQAVNSSSKEDATVTTGSISRLLTESGTGRNLIQTDRRPQRRQLRRPPHRRDRRRHRREHLRLDLDQNLFYAVSISELLPILDRNNIPYTIAEAGGGNTMMYVAIGAVVVVAVIAAVVVLSRKKKAAPAPQQPSQSQPEEETGRQPVLRSMAAQHGGMVVPLHHQPVQVGRDRAVCRLVYQDGTPGVSSRHCQIFFDEQENLFVVTDLNSTYGTFLADGQRLAPNTPVKLAPKSSIYLGEVANTIYLELE